MASEWVNWAGNVRCRPTRIALPRTRDELREVVKQATRVRAVGSGHSFNHALATDGVLVGTDKLNRVLEVDRERKRVRVEGGIKLRDLTERLAEVQLALPSLGDVNYQSIAGIVCTATHGSGMRWGTLSEAVAGVELVLADGQMLDVSDETTDDVLRAARVSLGALGVIASVTLQCVDVFNLRMDKELSDASDALEPEHRVANDHYELWYLPFVDKVQRVRKNRTTEERSAFRPVTEFLDEVVLENVLLEAMLRFGKHFPARVPAVMRVLANAAQKPSSTTDRGDKIFASERLFKAYDMEYALPIARAHEGIDALREAIAAHAKRGYYMHMPVEIRFVNADRGSFLSHAAGRDTCYIDLASYVGVPGYEAFFRDMEERFRDLGGRPHWGKIFFANPIDRYPDAGAFSKIRERLDPKGKLMSPFLDALFDGRALG